MAPRVWEGLVQLGHARLQLLVHYLPGTCLAELLSCLPVTYAARWAALTFVSPSIEQVLLETACCPGIVPGAMLVASLEGCW